MFRVEVANPMNTTGEGVPRRGLWGNLNSVVENIGMVGSKDSLRAGGLKTSLES